MSKSQNFLVNKRVSHSYFPQDGDVVQYRNTQVIVPGFLTWYMVMSQTVHIYIPISDYYNNGDLIIIYLFM